MRVVGYTRVSTREQSENGYGLDSQRAAIEAEAQRRGWDVIPAEDAGCTGKSIDRPGLTYALSLVSSGAAEALVVAKLDRLSRSMFDFVGLVRRAQREGWALIVLDPPLDLSTSSGRLTANVLASFAEWERELISQRTREGLAEAKRQGKPLGRRKGEGGSKPRVKADVQARILRERGAGLSFGEIARRLNADGVPTALGGRAWHPATVRGIIQRVEKEGK